MVKKLIDETWSILEGAALNTSGPSYGEYAIALGKNERVFSLAHLGEWLDPEKFNKYPTVYFKPTFNKGVFEYFSQQLRELRSGDWGEDSIKKAKGFTELWERIFLEEKHPEFWSYLLALYEEFYPKEINELERINELAIPIYERSFHLAGFIFYAAVKNGIYDGETLREIFLVGLFLDSGLAHPSFHYNFYTALEMDRSGTQSGITFLKEFGHSEEDIQFYINHGHVGFEFCKKTLAEYVQNERLFDLIKIHHETGPNAFPNGFTQYECDDIELIIILINQALPYSDISKMSIGRVIEKMGQSWKGLKSHQPREVAR